MKFCPKCTVRVEKESGCDHMTCSRCQYEWCWQCRCKFYSYSHEDIFFPYSCPHSVKPVKCCPMILLALCTMLCAPLMLTILPCLVCFYYCAYEGTVKVARCNEWLGLLCCPVFLILGVVFGLIGATLSLVLCLLPFVLYGVVRMFKACNIHDKCNICCCLTCII